MGIKIGPQKPDFFYIFQGYEDVCRGGLVISNQNNYELPLTHRPK
jgi:hypothetical protein